MEHVPAIPVLGIQRQKDHHEPKSGMFGEIKASLDCVMSHSKL